MEAILLVEVTKVCHRLLSIPQPRPWLHVGHCIGDAPVSREHPVNLTRLTNPCTEAGVHVWHTETGEHLYTFKSRDNSPVVAWAPTRYCLAYSENSVGGGLRIAGVETDRK